jgi:hypothetical protein
MEKMQSLYSSPNIVRAIKSTMMRQVEHVVPMGEGRSVYRVFVGRPEGNRPLEDLGTGGSITLRWILGRQGLMRQTEFGSGC